VKAAVPRIGPLAACFLGAWGFFRAVFFLLASLVFAAALFGAVFFFFADFFLRVGLFLASFFSAFFVDAFFFVFDFAFFLVAIRAVYHRAGPVCLRGGAESENACPPQST